MYATLIQQGGNTVYGAFAHKVNSYIEMLIWRIIHQKDLTSFLHSFNHHHHHHPYHHNHYHHHHKSVSYNIIGIYFYITLSTQFTFIKVNFYATLRTQLIFINIHLLFTQTSRLSVSLPLVTCRNVSNGINLFHLHRLMMIAQLFPPRCHQKWNFWCMVNTYIAPSILIGFHSLIFFLICKIKSRHISYLSYLTISEPIDLNYNENEKKQLYCRSC